MAVVMRSDAMAAANRMRLRVKHFALGTFPEADGSVSAMPVNRFFIPLANPSGAACWIEDGEKRLVLKRGFAYFIPLYRPASVRLDERLEFLSVHFNMELYDGADLFSRFGAICEAEGNWAEEVMTAYREPDPCRSAVLVRSAAERFAGEMMIRMPREAFAFAEGFDRFEPELAYIRKHCNAALTVEEVASVRGFRREVFSRNFSQATGMTPKQYIGRVLLNRASDLLINQDCLAREAAFHLGFANEFYFSRFFRKHTGLPPKQYQRLYRAKPSGALTEDCQIPAPPYSGKRRGGA